MASLKAALRNSIDVGHRQPFNCCKQGVLLSSKDGLVCTGTRPPDTAGIEDRSETHSPSPPLYPWKLPDIIHLFRSSRVDDARAGPLAKLHIPALCRALWAEVTMAQMLFQVEKQVISHRFS